MHSQLIQQLNAKTKHMSAAESLELIAAMFGKEASFSLGFGSEGMVIADIIFTKNLDIRVFTLDTGRLFSETYELFNKVYLRYKKKIDVYFPDREKVENLVSEKGPFSFYDSVDNRKECCSIRKLGPLKRALRGSKVWITGLRASQSEYRKTLAKFYWDEKHQVIKFNPLFEWTREEVKAYIAAHKVPYNRLEDKGFKSIGCAPCTRATQEGEQERSGRWWWENSQKECGLHESSSSTQVIPKQKKRIQNKRIPVCQKC